MFAFNTLNPYLFLNSKVLIRPLLHGYRLKAIRMKNANQFGNDSSSGFFDLLLCDIIQNNCF